MMFGPPDAHSPNTEQSMRWRIKRDTNVEHPPEVRRHHRAAGAGAPPAGTDPDLDWQPKGWSEDPGAHDEGADSDDPVARFDSADEVHVGLLG